MDKRKYRSIVMLGAVALLGALAIGTVIGSLSPPSLSAEVDASQRTATAMPADNATATTDDSNFTPAASIVPQSSGAPLASAAPAALPSSTAPPASAAPAPAYIEYTVVRGDLLNAIARRFNTTNDAIVALNPGINPDNLQVGQILRLPRQ